MLWYLVHSPTCELTDILSLLTETFGQLADIHGHFSKLLYGVDDSTPDVAGELTRCVHELTYGVGLFERWRSDY